MLSLKYRQWREAKEGVLKGLVEKLREMRSLMRVNLLNLLVSDNEDIFIKSFGALKFKTKAFTIAPDNLTRALNGFRFVGKWNDHSQRLAHRKNVQALDECPT